jgi:hypothetical protein
MMIMLQEMEVMREMREKLNKNMSRKYMWQDHIFVNQVLIKKLKIKLLSPPGL